jgi:hypothetical protein
LRFFFFRRRRKNILTAKALRDAKGKMAFAIFSIAVVSAFRVLKKCSGANPTKETHHLSTPHEPKVSNLSASVP